MALQKRKVCGAEPIQVDTFGGRLHVEWDTDSDATPIGQLAFFAAFLKNAGVLDDWVGDFRSITPALSEPWILDVDTTIKTLYGRQMGAEVGYNPRKPGRPFYAYHSYWIGNLRLVLDVEVSDGKAHTGSHALPGLSRLLEGLPPGHRPFLVRGDCGFGNDTILREMEPRQPRYLFKLKQSKNVRRLLVHQFQRHDWVNAGQGWEAMEDEIKHAGWERPRRVVILRRPVKEEPAVARRKGKQVEMLFPDDAGTLCYEYAILVSDCPVDMAAIAQRYRDRADAENGFDELKNQWGLRVHDEGHRPLPAHGANGGAGLKLVELVQPHGTTGRPPGSDHKSSAAAGRDRPDGSAWRSEPSVPDAEHAVRRVIASIRQDPCGFAACEAYRGAVALQIPMGTSGSLNRRTDSGFGPGRQTKSADITSQGGGVTAVSIAPCISMKDGKPMERVMP